MRRLLLSVFYFAVATISVYGQSRHEWMDFGDKAYNDKNYKLALACYQHVITLTDGNNRDLVTPYECRPYTNPKKSLDTSAIATAANDTVTLQNPHLVKETDAASRYTVNRVADCYRLLHDYTNAELWYRQALFMSDKRFPDVRFYYATALMNNAKYAEASSQFDTYAETLDPSNPNYKRATKRSVGCLFALDTASLKKEVIVTRLDSVINAGTAAFAATYYGDPDVLLFSAAKPGNVSTPELIKLGLDAYSSDIFTSKKLNGKWMKPEPISTGLGTLNSPANEGAAMVSFGKENLFFTRWSEDGKECAIFMCNNVNDKWLAPKRLDINVNAPGSKNMMPFLSNDGTTLYFVSDRTGGQGGLDIWVTQLADNGTASPAINLGPLINTVDDEVTPFFHFTTSTLFYSTNGMGGFGGYDIVKSAFNADDSAWSQPKNLEAPFNSSRDDAYFVMDRIQQHGYFSSDREPCGSCGPGSEFCYRAYQFSNEPIIITIHGHVFNSETNDPISTALLTFKDIRGNVESDFRITDADGYYEMELVVGEELYIKAQKNKFFGDATNISTVGVTESTVFEHDFYLTPIPAGEIVIPGIEYDFDKATLRPESQKILDDLVAFLELNDNISVEIASHTDTRGSDSYNLTLSQARAKSCVDYLISKGIQADRLEAKGYGETQTLIPDKDIDKMATSDEKEAAHQKNRRTSFRPVKEGKIKDKWEGKIPEGSHIKAPEGSNPH